MYSHEFGLRPGSHKLDGPDSGTTHVPASSHFIPHRNLDGIVRTFRKTTHDSKKQKLANRHNCRNLHISTSNSLLEQKYCISTGLSVSLAIQFILVG